ncbi:MAG: repeat containing protein [Thermomicrobiales bacterium]|jgi:DNA-binding beta-propeller fold protein YncE|nr:repeat containing protein [Thermomicrobiales bacterium]
MRRVSVLRGLLLATLTMGLWVAAGAQEVTTPVASLARQPALTEFVREIPLGEEGASAPSGVAVAADGTLYVIDSLTDQIRVFDRDGTVIATWGETGARLGQFRFEDASGFWGDLTLGPDGNLYVLDTFNSRVQVLSPDGEVLRAWGKPGSGEGQFNHPSGIGIDEAGRVYVAETGNARVQLFDSEGRFLAAWAPPGAETGLFPNVVDVAVDTAGTVSVTDNARNRIYRYDAAGTVIGVFGEIGQQSGQLLHPWGIAVDAAGNLYVAEFEGQRVQILAPDGTLRGVVGSLGTETGYFSGPIYLTVSPDGLLYVADEGNQRVQVFRLLPPLAPPVGTPTGS